jgi:Zn-dependent M28 family amino/carboxypeptidase
VQEAQIRTHIERLSGAADAPTRAGPRRILSRSDYHPHIQYAADYIAETLAALGLEVRRIPFSFDSPEALVNIEATLHGEQAPNEIYVLTAHYDSTAKLDPTWVAATDPAPGADDDGSGAALVLEAARVLSGVRLRATMRFILFAGEEVGLVGSAAYAQAAKQRGDDLRLIVSMDPVGNTGTFAGHVFFTFNAMSSLEAAAMQTIGPRYGIGFPVVAVPGDLPGSPDNRSDHANFWAQGFLALHGGSLPGDEYHTPKDTVDKVDIHFAGEATRVVVARFAELAGVLAAQSAPGGCSCAHGGGAQAPLVSFLAFCSLLLFAARRRAR